MGISFYSLHNNWPNWDHLLKTNRTNHFFVWFCECVSLCDFIDFFSPLFTVFLLKSVHHSWTPRVLADCSVASINCWCDWIRLFANWAEAVSFSEGNLLLFCTNRQIIHGFFAPATLYFLLCARHISYEGLFEVFRKLLPQSSLTSSDVFQLWDAHTSRAQLKVKWHWMTSVSLCQSDFGNNNSNMQCNTTL